MTRLPVVGIGALGCDVVYVLDQSRSQLYRIGSRGGGSLWNALANARVNGAETIAFCVGGADSSANLCIKDLQNVGVKIAKEQFQRGKRTRTIHEVLSLRSVSLGKPKHEFRIRCPVCGSDTYKTGTARLTKEFMKETAKALGRRAETGIIIHLDGVDSARLNPAKSLRGKNGLISLDLGRSTGFYRMHQVSLVEKLRGIDALFVHSKVLPELVRQTGASSIKSLLGLLESKILVSTRGEKGVVYWIRDGNSYSEYSEPSAGTNALLDTAGAGDALIGSFLAQLASTPADEVASTIADISQVRKMIHESQKWAAHKCGFVGARGHIPGLDGNTWSWDLTKDSLRTSGSVEELKLANLSRTRCVSCESLITEIGQTSISTLRFRQNVSRLPSKAELAWKNRKEYQWPQLEQLDNPGYAVGTGGSFAVAHFAALLLTKSSAHPVVPIRPFDFIRYGVKVPSAVFISNSGKTPDVLSALDHALTLGIQQRVFITGANPQVASSHLRQSKDLLLCTGANGERGFLSVAGTIIPCFMIWASLNQTIWSSDDGYQRFHTLYEHARARAAEEFSELEKSIPRGLSDKRVVILGGGYAWPAMLDMESKMVESANCLPEISEMKDYSHGRFVSSIDSRTFTVVFGMPDDRPYREFLMDRLRHSKPVIELTTDFSEGEGALELMLQAEHFMRLLAEKSGVDLSPPRISPRGLQLYRYPDLLNFNSSHQSNGK
jgi:sugar/nucleoside kinase (ribokinase family)/fructoselysine-6-P-deglycase FrlB-like protein